jgi:hypothetical protein
MNRSARSWRGLVRVAITVTLALVAVAAAQAQGFFYQEVAKDGRIFVFNDMKAYDNWVKTGDAGKSIVRIGAGPNGETMVFDTEEAIHLYNFKHNVPGEVIAKPAAPFAPTIAWKDGKTTFSFEKAQIVLSNRIQVRYTLNDPEDETKNAKGSFRIRRAKTKFEGWLYVPYLTYEAQFVWTDQTTGPVEWLYFNYDFTRGRNLFNVKAGQFKVPYGREQLTSSGSQQFVDRSLVSDEFAKGGDQGIQFSGGLLGNKLDWRVGMFNGNGRNKSENDNVRYQYDARVTYQPWGDVRYSESDFESTDHPLLAIAGQWERNNFEDTLADDTKNFDQSQWGGDVVFKYRGFSAFGEYHHRTRKPQLPGTDLVSDGLGLQAGYFFIPQKFELALRHAEYDPNTDLDQNTRTENGLAVNWFFNKHAMKLQGDVRWVKDEALLAQADTTKEARLQMQFIF